MNTKVVIGVIAVVIIAIGGYAYAQKKSSYSSMGSGSTVNTASSSTATFTLADVAAHKDAASCYTTISDSVYDLTEWIGRHPGGEDGILAICGKDGTEAFMNQHHGAKRQEDILVTFKIGTLAK